MRYRLGIVGGGRAAWAFGSTWRRIGWPLAGVALRNDSPSQIARLLEVETRPASELASASDLLLLAVSDRAIRDVAAQISANEAVVFHASGSLPSLLGGFSLHPLRVLPPVGEPSDLAGSLLVFEGAHRDAASEIASAVGARLAEIEPDQKPLYHAAAVFGANYVAALLEIAQQIAATCGIRDARDDFAALARSAIDNWLRHDDARRFTGPAARGDEEVLARHVEALASDPKLAHLYELLAAEIRRAGC